VSGVEVEHSTKFLDLRWLFFLKQAGYIDIICNKSTIAHYTAIKVANTVVALPPPNEEKLIVDYLDRETAQIDRLKGEVEASIDLLQRYRTALISAAVTGKIDVRAPAAASCPSA
jgi:type I restriction enzyme S subunit